MMDAFEDGLSNLEQGTKLAATFEFLRALLILIIVVIIAVVVMVMGTLEDGLSNFEQGAKLATTIELLDISCIKFNLLGALLILIIVVVVAVMGAFEDRLANLEQGAKLATTFKLFYIPRLELIEISSFDFLDEISSANTFCLTSLFDSTILAEVMRRFVNDCRGLRRVTPLLEGTGLALGAGNGSSDDRGEDEGSCEKEAEEIHDSWEVIVKASMYRIKE